MKRAAALPVSLVALLAVVLVACGPGGAPEPTAVPEQPSALPSTPAVPVPTPTSPGDPTAEAGSPTPTQVPSEEEEAAPTPSPTPPLEISSSAFESGAEIPVQYSCHGENLSPPLEWAGVPEGTESLALLMNDPDSEPPGFVHWVIYNIPAASPGLPEGVAPDPSLPDGARQGNNDFAQYPAGTFPDGSAINQVGYDGPCPPAQHRYVFKLYALDVTLDVPAESTMGDVLAAMEGHVLGEAELTGVFTPPSP
jgi:Raf kinase inhibitor-like YbhB/YbcL family protein